MKKFYLMNYIHPIIPLYMILFLFTGCDKQLNNQKCDLIDSPIEIGKVTECVEVSKFETPIILSTDSQAISFYNIDFDKDGGPDLRIEIGSLISPNGTHFIIASLRTIDCLIACEPIHDEIHKCTYSDSLSTTITLYTLNTDFKCDKGEPNGVVWSNVDLYPKIYNFKDKQDIYERWEDYDLDLFDANFSKQLDSQPFTLSQVIKGNWFNQPMKYVMFKKETSSKVAYGWILLSVYESKILIHEYAYQK